MKKNTVQMPMEQLRAPISDVDAKARTFTVQWLSGERVKRYDWMSGQSYWLEFSKADGAARLSRFASGRAPVLNAHSQWDLMSVLGVVEGAEYKKGIGTSRVRLSGRDDVKGIVQDVADGIISNASIGVSIFKKEILPPDAKSEGLAIHLATDFEPFELSFVPVGADSGAGVVADHRQHLQSQRTFPCEILERVAPESPADPANQTKEPSMKTEQELAAEEAAKKEHERKEAQEAAAAAAKAERARLQLIDDLCKRHGLQENLRSALINGDDTPDQIRAKVLETLSEQTERAPVRGASHADVHIIGDDRLQMRTHMVEALLHRVAPAAVPQLSDGARQYRGMSLLRLAEEVLTVEGVKCRGKSPMEIAQLSMLSTSDFPNILADVANKRLRQAYADAVPSYTRWARRAANAPDFKNINVTQLSAAPDLKKVLEGAEYTYGALSDGKEVYAVITYGRIITLTRQAIINDDLNAFDRLPRAFAGSARRLENYLVYQQLLSNPNLSDGVALFHATHGNLPAAAAISATSLGLARALMRKQTGKQAEKLNLAPRWLLAGPDKEQEAYQYTSSQFVPAKSADVNEFRAGGRTALEPVIDNEIDGTKWFLAADNSDVDTVEYCYLEGSEGVYLESVMGFKIDGVDLKARLDFAAKVIDHRGLVYNSGA